MQSTWKKRPTAQFVGLMIGMFLVASCAIPAAPAPASEAGAAAPQFSVTPPTSEEDSGSPSAAAGVGEVVSSTITTTTGAPLATDGALPGNKETGQLPNVDSATNQLFGEWLTTTGVGIAALTPDVRAASPTVTVTVVLAEEGAAESVKAALATLNGVVLDEAGTMVVVQLPVGQIDQLAQVPGVLLVQAPSVGPPVGFLPREYNAPPTHPGRFGFDMPPNSGVTAGEPVPFLPDAGWTQEELNAWANSIPIEWEGLAELQAQKSGYLGNADSTVNQAYMNWQAQVVASGADSVQAAWSSEPVVVTLIMESEAAAITAKELLAGVNAQLLDSFGEWLVVSVPVGQIAALTALPGVLLAQQPTQQPPVELSGEMQEPTSDSSATPDATNDVVTEGVAKSRINVWHNAGFEGNGVKVAVMDSFNQALIDAAFDEGEIPTRDLNGPSTGTSHGVAVAEIVHDMAPKATLTLHSIDNAPDYCVAVANKIDALAKAGNHIITSSIGPTFCPSAGDGTTNPMAQMVRRALYDYNTLYLQAAGNHAGHHYEATYRGIQAAADLNVHDYTGGNIIVNVLTINTPSGKLPANFPAFYPIGFYLRWDGGWPQSAQDYDMYLVRLNEDAGRWEFLDCLPYPCHSNSLQNGGQMPFERIETYTPSSGAYAIVISKYSATGDHFLDLLTSHAQPGLAYNTPSRSLVAAASYEHAYAVAAVHVDTLAIEGYSSNGPTYGPGNAPNGGFSQPQIAGFANVSTFVASGFNGTSAATPHVAGAAAVLKSAAPCLSSRQLGDWLQQYATDKGAAGYDFTFGAGILNFPAVSARPSCTRTNLYVPNLQR